MQPNQEDPNATPVVQPTEPVEVTPEAPTETQPVDAPAPDPSNSSPETWTEDLHPDEVAEVTRQLDEEHPCEPEEGV